MDYWPHRLKLTSAADAESSNVPRATIAILGGVARGDFHYDDPCFHLLPVGANADDACPS